jgi:hypothetical protein
MTPLTADQAFKSGVAINDVDRMKTWLNSEDQVNRVVKNLKDTILAVKYMATPAINTIYKNQGQRVANQLAVAEAGLQGNWQGTATPYTIQGLDRLWNQFMHDYTDEVIGKFEAYLNLWSGSLAVWLPTQGEQLSDSRKALQTKIENIRNEINTLTASQLFNNPF